MSEQSGADVRALEQVDRPSARVHELVNVVSAMRMQVFMTRRLLAAGADATRSVEDSLDRLERVVDRAVELATGLEDLARALEQEED